MDRADVVVVGGGLMGSATARVLGERGVDTILLEQFRRDHALGSSHGPSRIFRLSYPDPLYVRLARRALATWHSLQDRAGERLLETSGGLDAGPVAESCAAALAECGVEHVWLQEDEVRERFPLLDVTGLGPVLYQPDAGVCLAQRTVEALYRLSREAGVDVREEVAVEAVEPGDERVVVRTSGGEIAARVAVLTTGSWTGPLVEAAGVPLALTPILQHVSYFRPDDRHRPQDAGPGTTPTFIEWGLPELAWYALPAAGGAPGLKLGEHVGGREVDPRNGPFEVDQAMARSHAGYVRRRFPGLDPEPLLTETCLYTMTPEEDFVLDRVGNLVIGTGFSGHGFKFGPLMGEILADLATGHDPGIPLERFGVARPTLRPAPI